jgi:hypothetical protein
MNKRLGMVRDDFFQLIQNMWLNAVGTIYDRAPKEEVQCEKISHGISSMDILLKLLFCRIKYLLKTLLHVSRDHVKKKK